MSKVLGYHRDGDRWEMWIGPDDSKDVYDALAKPTPPQDAEAYVSSDYGTWGSLRFIEKE